MAKIRWIGRTVMYLNHVPINVINIWYKTRRWGYVWSLENRFIFSLALRPTFIYRPNTQINDGSQKVLKCLKKSRIWVDSCRPFSDRPVFQNKKSLNWLKIFCVGHFFQRLLYALHLYSFRHGNPAHAFFSCLMVRNVPRFRFCV